MAKWTERTKRVLGTMAQTQLRDGYESSCSVTKWALSPKRSRPSFAGSRQATASRAQGEAASGDRVLCTCAWPVLFDSRMTRRRCWLVCALVPSAPVFVRACVPGYTPASRGVACYTHPHPSSPLLSARHTHWHCTVLIQHNRGWLWFRKQ